MFVFKVVIFTVFSTLNLRPWELPWLWWCCLLYRFLPCNFQVSFWTQTPPLLSNVHKFFMNTSPPFNKICVSFFFFFQSSGKLMFFIFGNHAPGTSAEENCCICRATALAWRWGLRKSTGNVGYQLWGGTPTGFFFISNCWLDLWKGINLDFVL